MTALPVAAVAFAAYLLGSIPFGFLVARARGVDIRSVGSRNIGATNVFRTLGKGPGLLTFALDFLKGYASSALLPLAALALVPGGAAPESLRLAGGLGAVAGHAWPLFLGFRGGKGVATSAGMLLGIAPSAIGLAFAAWALVFALSRYVSLASISAAVFLGALVWAPRFCAHRPTSLLLTLLAAVVVVRHRANIARLARGAENRFEFRRAPRRRADPGKEVKA